MSSVSASSATVKNGEIVTSASQDSLSKVNEKSNSGMDKDAFLQLLVAQMKYQDPLEPTSNTEYISQYAQFSQVEALNNMSTTMELSRYSTYVGKEVILESTDGSGKSTQTRGFVDYVTFEEGKAYLSIEGNLYKASDIVSVISSEFSTAEDIAKQFAQTIKDLPAIDQITIENNGNTITNLLNLYNSIGDYEKSFIDDDDVAKMNLYVAKLNDLLIAAANAAAKEEGNTNSSEETAEETAGSAGAAEAVSDENA
ncbi:MAG: hypothetical protein J6P78_07030 [Lachnospiraceae bacterium]|nr:hypothetical protein [Lachnospiraceae bacterium]